MTTTLASGLKSSSVDFAILHKKYKPVLALVKELIGVVPVCDPILEIWPTGFRTYNLLVPNMFNLPQTIWGNKSFKAAMGLAMYTSSRAAACPYCSAHTCSFALRRGASKEAIIGSRTPAEQAVVAMAESLSGIPAYFTVKDYQLLTRHFSPERIESLAFSVSMMGFLNKFMDAIGVELEQEAINDTAELMSKTGWTPGKHVDGPYRITEKTTPEKDNFLTYLRVIRQAPGAVLLEKKWTRGVPDRAPQACAYLKQLTGYHFPLLQQVSQKRVILALTTVLRDNLSKENTEVGLDAKCLAGYIFARKAGNQSLTAEARAIAAHIAPAYNDALFEKLDQIATMSIPEDQQACEKLMATLTPFPSVSTVASSTVLLSVGASPSPAEINDAIIQTISKQLSPKMIVEVVVWISVMQLLHRLGSYYSVANQASGNQG